MDSVVLNLLTNAIKYRSPERDSFAQISGKVEKQHFILSIADNGLGIDLQRHGNKLFGMYKTFHTHEDSRGVGLFMTKNQIDAMGGRIEVSSEVNIGTTFKIYIQYEKD
jgi:signal transduction histidine kinase